MNAHGLDTLTAGAKRALDTLFVANPTGTSLGVFCGVLFHGMLQFLAPSLSQIEAVRFSAVRMWHTCAAGIIVFNIRPYLRRSKIDPRVTEALDFVEAVAKRTKMPALQRKRMYENLIAKILADVVLDAPTQKDVNAIKASISSQESMK
jgi:hypothetical protein